ncbi:protein SYM1 [Violaceomyces palustris]|uniref:Protein SYM1 n=1 Tax=Violaceomyces palustris TaxID=1673888 RepID=A0ACD0NYR9_9BASI|nr:protein SYM1 [Violaceomyces palustris]
MSAAIQRFLHATSSTLPRQCMSAGVLFATGDIIAQQAIEKKGKKHDFVRTARLTAYGGLIFSPIMAVWFGKVLERIPIKGRVGSVAAKVALDQGLAAPNMVALFFAATTLMEGKGTKEVKEKLEANWWSTLKTSWMVWIPVQTINMALVPPTQRLLFVNVVSVFWNTFLSLVSGGTKGKVEVTDEYGAIELIEAKVDKLH